MPCSRSATKTSCRYQPKYPICDNVRRRDANGVQTLQLPHGFRTKALNQYSNVDDMAGLGWLTQRVPCTACRQKKVAGYKSPSRPIAEVFLAAGKRAFVDEEEAF